MPSISHAYKNVWRGKKLLRGCRLVGAAARWSYGALRALIVFERAGRQTASPCWMVFFKTFA